MPAAWLNRSPPRTFGERGQHRQPRQSASWSSSSLLLLFLLTHSPARQPAVPVLSPPGGPRISCLNSCRYYQWFASHRCAGSGPSLPCKVAAPPVSSTKCVHTYVAAQLSASISLLPASRNKLQWPAKPVKFAAGILQGPTRRSRSTLQGQTQQPCLREGEGKLLARVRCQRQPRSYCLLIGPICQTADSIPVRYADNTLSLMLSHPHLAKRLRIKAAEIEPSHSATLPPVQLHHHPLHPLQRAVRPSFPPPPRSQARPGQDWHAVTPVSSRTPMASVSFKLPAFPRSLLNDFLAARALERGAEGGARG